MTDRADADIELIRRYLGGDISAFDELMAAHENRVFAICLRMLRNRDAALDATQDTFLTVFRKADRYKAEAAFSTWLYRVTVNTCYDHLRRRSRRPTEPLAAATEPVDQRAATEIHAAELRPDIEAALQALTPEFRAAVVLVDLQGMSLETAANTLDVAVGTVKSRLFRGRRILAESLGNLSTAYGHPKDE